MYHEYEEEGGDSFGCGKADHIYLRDFYSFHKMLVHLKLLTCFVLPGFISATRSLKKNPLEFNEFEPVMYNHVY